ncbi:hypothetical protein PN462_15695 [Spirulina sp. CS-785/01]|uniref:hypothetical protein n=1 Tax=Spirulina sp. CS-785/01 TaxID=3021716 RepID=UPI00232A8A36|nr:hypothetical protein [Spirulina sp. CS-785/01]MDB9314554.1 hypothetical protein [Spirulina sp. CS-785/01]
MVQFPHNGNITIAAVPGKNQIELSHEGMVIDLHLKATPTEGEVSLPQDITGIKPTDIPALLTGGDVKEANTAIIEEDGTVRLVASDTVGVYCINPFSKS